MRHIVYAVLAIGLVTSLGGFANAADVYPSRGYSRVWYGSDCCSRGVYSGPGIRVAEQAPYCVDCENLIGPNRSRNGRLVHFGYPYWADGSCYRKFCN